MVGKNFTDSDSDSEGVFGYEFRWWFEKNSFFKNSERATI